MGWVQNLKHMIRAYREGAPKKKKEEPVKDTTRTKYISGALKTAGVTEKELKRLRGG